MELPNSAEIEEDQEEIEVKDEPRAYLRTCRS